MHALHALLATTPACFTQGPVSPITIPTAFLPIPKLFHTGALFRRPPKSTTSCPQPAWTDPCLRHSPAAMARRTQDDDNDPVHTLPPTTPPSFLSLPYIAHASIASFLPDRNEGNDSRLRVSKASRAMLKSYGGSLSRVKLRYIEDSGPARLFALLGRQEKLETVVVGEQEAIPAFCLAIVQDCCQQVQRSAMGFIAH